MLAALNIAFLMEKKIYILKVKGLRIQKKGQNILKRSQVNYQHQIRCQFAEGPVETGPEGKQQCCEWIA